MKRLSDVLEGKWDNYILPFFWQHGEEEETLRHYMRVIKAANIGAVCVESRPHPDFCGEKWWRDMDVILEEAKALGMKVWILDDSHFPTGFANGAVESAPAELTHQYMVYRTLEMHGPAAELELDVREYMKPEPTPPWMPPAPAPKRVFDDDELVAVLACPVTKGAKLGDPLDLTGQIDPEGRLFFSLSDGYWKIFVVYLTRNAKGRNNYINFMDRESCRLLIDAVYEPHYAHYADYFGNVIAGFFSDEPPIGNTEGYMPAGPIGTAGQNLPWSREAAARLTKEFGGEGWKRHLPYLWADAADANMQAKERGAFMQMVSKLVAECFSAQNGAWCAAHGVEYIGHMLEDCDMNSDMGISMGHFFRGLSGQHMAGIDNIGGQVMINGQDVSRHPNPACPDEAGFYQYLLGKLGASHAAIDPKKQGRTMCENFGAYGWQSGTKEQKFMMDHFMARGVNRFVPHAFTPAPFPDPDCPPHFYAHGENPLYRAFGELMAYSSRVCHLIDGGKPCPDVALLYNGESKWAGGAQSNVSAARALAAAQVDFHVLPSDVFACLDQKTPDADADHAAEADHVTGVDHVAGAWEDGTWYPAKFDGKTLVVNGVSYQALVISGCRFVEQGVAAFIGRALAKGFPVLFLDQKPCGVTGSAEDENVRFRELLAGCETVPATEAGVRAAALVRPQVVAEPAFRRLVTYHYQNGADTYLLLNEHAAEAYLGSVTLRGEGTPVRYYPWENRLETVEYQRTEEGVTVQIRIDPLELAILALDPEGTLLTQAKPPVCYEGIQKEITEFTVSRVTSKDYLAGNGVIVSEPEEVHAPFTGMQKTYPDFSGYYIYETDVEMEKGKHCRIVLEDVCESAEVFVNGTGLGMRLQRPFAFDVPGELVKNKNRIRIETATLLERKLAGEGVNIRGMSPYRPLSATGIVGKAAIEL